MYFGTIVFVGLTYLTTVAALPPVVPDSGALVAAHHTHIAYSSKVGDAPAVKRYGMNQPASDYVLAGSETFVSVNAEEPISPVRDRTSDVGGFTLSNELFAIFPGGVKSGLSTWSTDPAVGGALPLSDESLGAIKVVHRLVHPVVDYAGKKAMKVSFARGTFGLGSPAGSGISLYALGPSDKPIGTAKTLTFSYSVRFSDGFQFGKGGKLPGLYGGTSNDEAISCSGGHARPTCWSARFMWRKEGAGELYAYLPSDAKDINKAAVCERGNNSCDKDKGWSLGRGKWTWTPGAWQRVAQKVTLNDIGQANGSIVTYVDGKEVYAANNVMIRTQRGAEVRGAMVQSFFGGSDASWGSPADQEVYFADFSIAVLETE